jgi:hypothetical protein
MHVPINVKSPNNIIKWQMGFNSAFKGLTEWKSPRESFGNSKFEQTFPLASDPDSSGQYKTRGRNLLRADGYALSH